MKTGILIQVRTDSERFPKKVLELIEDKPMLWHIIERCKLMQIPIIVTTSNRTIDDSIIKIAQECKVDYFRGSSEDVLDRFYRAAKEFSLELIIRITADCPLIDPLESLKVLDVIQKNKVDYVALDEKTYPDGLDTEIFTFNALEHAWKNAKLKSQREHVTPFIYHPHNKFKILKVPYSKNYSHLRFTVDYKDDLEFVRTIYSKLYDGTVFFLEKILTLIEHEPELLKINSSHKRNEGYQKSLRDDKII